jgi:hypothetical protein
MWCLRYAKRESLAVRSSVLRTHHADEGRDDRWYYESVLRARAGVSEQADDLDSKSSARKGVGVRLPSPAPSLTTFGGAL